MERSKREDSEKKFESGKDGEDERMEGSRDVKSRMKECGRGMIEDRVRRNIELKIKRVNTKYLMGMLSIF